MKNKFVLILLTVAIFIPSIVSVVYYNKANGGAADTRNTLSVTMKDIAGNTFVFDRNDGEKSIETIASFLDMNNNATEIASIPSTIENNDFYQVTVSTSAKDAGYKYYFTLISADCYFIDGNGKAYQIAEKDAQAFLESPYAASLYENGTPPVLSFGGEHTAKPSASKWSFKNSTGAFTEADTTFSVTEKIETYTMEGGMVMNFSVKPDYFGVKITDKSTNQVVFDDLYENIASLTITDSMQVHAEVSAKWYEDAERDFYGEQTYTFDAALNAPAAFYAGATTLQIGEFICVTGTNVSAPENITFSSEPSINYTPVFCKDSSSGEVHALIPFNWDLTAGNYTLNFAYGGASQQININLTQRTNPFRDRTINIDSNIAATYGSAAALQRCQETLEPIAQKASAIRYWEGSFLPGADEGALKNGFGHNLKVAGTDIQYRHTGIDYALRAGTDIQAVNAGEVLYAGYLDYSGYTVVIEHGYGLKSWYCHMTSASVAVGDKVEKGVVIGTAGSSGFTGEAGVHIGMTVFDVPVCQYTLWDSGTNKGIPVYTAE